MGKRIISLQEAQSVTNNDYLVIDNQSGGTKKVSAGFINDIVSDVEVDGISVVNNGVAEIDLSGKQDTIVAGSNITIAADGKTISATDTTYTAGANVQINNGVISATDTTYTAGTGIDITGGVISSAITPGSTVTVTPSLVSGTKVADYSIDGTSGALYAPTPTVDDVEVDGASVVSSGVATINTMTGATSQANGTKGLVPAPTTTDTDKYLKGDGTWDTPSGGGGASAISDLTDVNLTNLSNGQILKYDSANQEWVNANESGGSSVIPNPTGTATDTLSSISINGTIYDIEGGGETSGYIQEILSYGVEDQNTISLSSPYTNYDEILFTWTYNTNQYITSLKLNTEDIDIGDTIILDDYTTRNFNLTVTSTTLLTIVSKTTGMKITSIRGLSYSSTQKKDTRDTLWSSGSYSLAHPITDYDEIVFNWGSNSFTSFIPSDIMTYRSIVIINPNTNAFIWFDVTDASTLTVHQDYGLSITSIDGVIYTREQVQYAKTQDLSLTEYNALSEAQKKNGTIYFVGEATATSQLIPRVSGTDSAITSSGKTHYNGGDNWRAFDGVESASGIANCWAADENNTSAYIQYHFSQPYYLTQIQLKLYSHYSGDWTGTLNVLGSNDGSNWTNIASTGQEVSVTAPLNTMNIETIDLDDSDAWEYIRIQANGTAFNVEYQPCCDFSEIYVYGASVPIVVEDYDIYFMGNKYTNNMDVTDLDFLDLKISQVSDITTMLNSGTNDSDSGTFISGTHRYEKVSVICGFKPDYVRVDFSLPGGATYAIYDSSVSTTTSHWIIPGEGNDYTIILGSETGESGISDITDNGFKFRVNAGNTFEKTCTYTARVGGTTLVQTFDFSTLTQTQIDDLKSVLGLT